MAAELPPDAAVAALARSLQRLDNRVRRWSATRWQTLSADGRQTRSQAAYDLARTLAGLGRRAGNGAPDVVPEPVGPHAIADQLAVLGREVLTAPGAAAVAEEALTAVDRLQSVL